MSSMGGGEAGRIYTTVGADIAPLEAGLAKADSLTRTAARKMQAQQIAAARSLGSTLTRSVTLPVVAMGAASVKSALDFNKQMTLIRTAAGASGASVKQLTGQVLSLAKVTPYGPNELAKALYHLKSLGYDNATAMKALRVAIKGAEAGGADLEATTSALGGAIRTAAKGTGDYTKAMATLVATVGAGNMRMDDLNSALGTGLLPAAKAAGISIRDVGAALATMTDENMPADAAATRLRMTLALMDGPSTTARKAMESIGLKSTDLAHALQGPSGLIGAVQLLKTHLEQVQDPAERAGLLVKMFGGGRSAAAIELLVNNLDVLRRKYTQIGTTAGTFNSRVLAAQHSELNQLKTAWSSVQVAMIQFGQTLIPMVTKAANGLAKLSGWFSSLSQTQKKWLAGTAMAMALGGPLLLFTTKVIEALKQIKTLFALEAAASTASTGTIVANEARQVTALEAARLKASALKGMLLGLGKLGLITVAVNLVVTGNRYSPKDKWTWGGIANALNPANWGKDIKAALGGHAPPSVPHSLTGGAGKNAGLRGGLLARGSGVRMEATYPHPSKAQAQQMVQAVAKQYGIPVGLALAQINQESGFNYAATSGAGAEGIAQFMPGTAREYGVMNPYNAAQALQGYGKMMSKLIKSYGLAGALSAYNSGSPTAYKNPSFAHGQTYNYVHSILAAAGISSGGLGGSQSAVDAVLGLGGGKKPKPKKPSMESASALVHLKDRLQTALENARKVVGPEGKKLVASVSKLYDDLGKSMTTSDAAKLTDSLSATTKKITAALSFQKSEAKWRADARKAFAGVQTEVSRATGKQKAKLEAQMKAISKQIPNIASQSDLDKVKNRLKQVDTAFRRMVTTAKQRLTSAQGALSTAFGNVVARVMDAFDAQTQQGLDRIQAKYGALTPAEKQLQALQDAHDTAQRQQQLASDQAALAQAKTPADVAAAKQAIAEDEYQIQVAALQKQADAQRAAADAQEQQAENQYSYMRDLQKTALQQQLDDLKVKLESGKESVAQYRADLAKILASAGIDFSVAGSTLGDAFSEAWTDSMNTLIQTLNNLIAAYNKVAALTGGAQASLVSSWPQPTPAPNTLTQAAKLNAAVPGAISKHGAVLMAAGGIVRGGLGGVPAIIGERSYDEAVVPLTSGAGGLTQIIRGALKGAGGRGGPLVQIDSVTMNNDLDVELAAIRIGRELTTRLAAV